MKPLDQAIRDAFLEGIRRRGVATVKSGTT